MNILYLSYWGIKEGLTNATVLPHLKILATFEKVAKITLCTIERNGTSVLDEPLMKVEHKPLYSGLKYVDKINDFVRFPRDLASLVNSESIDFVIARGSPAGALAYLIHKKNKVPFVVESFEPHAEYMRESGVWYFWDPRYLFQRFWEKQQRKYAQWLLPVAHRYKKELIRLGVDERKIIIVPCAVDFTKFQVKEEQRQSIRKKIGADDLTIVGIYVGKFGGIYWDDKAFHFLGSAKKFFKNFKLLILSPDNNTVIEEKLLAQQFGSNDFLVTSATHDEVSTYLSAADLAFTFYRPSPSKRFLSPIKIGEYWSCGLPVMLDPSVGDDAELIKKYKIGVLFTMENKVIDESFNKMMSLIKDRDNTKARTLQVAKEFRSFEYCRMAYSTILNAK